MSQIQLLLSDTKIFLTRSAYLKNLSFLLQKEKLFYIQFKKKESIPES